MTKELSRSFMTKTKAPLSNHESVMNKVEYGRISSPRRKRRSLGVYVLTKLLGIVIFGVFTVNLIVLATLTHTDHVYETAGGIGFGGWWFQRRPHLPVAGVDIDVPSLKEWPIVHIVNTRFMQHQGTLLTLGEARYRQFMTFCFPTMIRQTKQDFLWIIKTDPAFTSTRTFQKLMEAVTPYPNIYLVASNTNFLTHPLDVGSWKDGSEGMDLLQSKIYSGNITKLHQAIALRNLRPVVETRLDADDGLALEYMSYIFKAALMHFLAIHTTVKPKPQWMYWCTRRHLEWHSSVDSGHSSSSESEDDTKEKDKNVEDQSMGFLNPVQHDHLCVTPGISIGFNIEVDPSQVPVYSHDELYNNMHNSTDCYGPQGKHHQDEDWSCLELVEEFQFSALRSRTWTSHGMLKVDLEREFFDYIEGNDMTKGLWHYLEKNFAVEPSRIKQTQSFLLENQAVIALDNLAGQCTAGHSCKQKAEEDLRRRIGMP